MFIHVIKANYVSDYKIKFKFDNNESGVVDLANELQGEIFKPLKNVKYFKKFHLNKEVGTITWENGADFAPEFLYSKIKNKQN